MPKFTYYDAVAVPADSDLFLVKQGTDTKKLTYAVLKAAVLGSENFTTATNPALNAATATAIVDAYNGVVVTLTAAGNNQTIGNPTVTTAVKKFHVINNDTSTHNLPVIANGVTFTVTPGEAQTFLWDGTAWGPIDLGITAVPVIVAQGGTGLATLTDGGIMLGSGTGAVTVTAQPTNGQVLIGSTGGDPVLASITGTANQITVTGGAGTITLSTPQNTHTAATPTFAGMTISAASASINLKDSDCAVADINFQILIAATDTGDGSEDIDVAFKAQVAGTEVTFINFDADGDLTLGYTGQSVAIAAAKITGGTIDGATIGKAVITPTYTVHVDGNRTDSYTEDGGQSRPYKTVLAALTAINADTGKSWILKVAPGTYADNLTITGPRHLRVEGMGGVDLSGTILINSGVGSYDRIEFVGVQGGRAEKGPALTISGKITATRTNDSLIYVGFHGALVSGEFEATTSGTWVLQYENCRVNGAITGTFSGTDPDETILIESYGFNEFVGAITGKTSFYNCNGSDFYSNITTTPWYENRFAHCSFGGSVSIVPQVGASSAVTYIDGISYKSMKARTPTLTGVTLSHTDGGVMIGATTEILVGSGDGTNPVWGTDIPTAVTIGSKYVYRADGTDVPVADGGTGASTLTDGGVLVGSGTGAITALAVGTNGQVLVGSTGADPVFASVTGGDGIDITEGAGTIAVSVDIKANGGLVIDTTELTVDLGASGITGTLAVGDGGTGATTLADGGLVVGNGASAVEVVAAGLTTQILVGGGASTNPAWGTDIPTAVTIGAKYIYRADGTDVPVADGGSGASTLTDGGILLGSGTDPFTATAQPTDGQVLIGKTGSDPVLASITGTTNQVTVTGGAGTITLSTPQDIHTGASPTFAGETIKASSPIFNFKDSDCTDDDVNASIVISATDTGSGSEDIDVAFKAQIAGVETTFINFDADGQLALGYNSQPAAFGGAAINKTTTVTTAGPTDNLDVSGVNTVFINTGSNDVTIGGLIGGVAGQQLRIVIIDATNDATLEHAEGTGNQDIYLESGADETKAASYGGWVLECNGTNWYQTGGGGGTSGYKTIFIPGAAMTSTATNGATFSTNEYATNDINMDFLEFDGATEEFAEFQFPMPEDWDLGTVKAKFYWTSATGSTAGDTVEWEIAGGALSNDDAIDAALGTAQVISDTLLANDGADMQLTGATPAITIGGTPALADLVHFKVSRNVGGTDDMTEDAWLFGVWIQYKADKTPAIW